MKSRSHSLENIQRQIDEVKQFLSVTLSISNAHTVEFFTHDVWKRFTAVSPQEVLRACAEQQREPESSCACADQQRAPEPAERCRTAFGFSVDSKQLVDTLELIRAAKARSLPGLGACLGRDELLQQLRRTELGPGAAPADIGGELEADEFMNPKKSHEVQSMSEVVARLAEHCGVSQVVDVGSGKGYLSSFLSLRFGLRVYGIDSSSTNTHGAQERNRKLKKFSRAYQRRAKADAARPPQEDLGPVEPDPDGDLVPAGPREEEEEEEGEASTDPAVERRSEPNPETEELFLSAMSADLVEAAPPRIPPGRLSEEERERRKRENLDRKSRSRAAGTGAVFSPLTSYVTAETELRELITELEDAVLVGLHTCGNLAPSTLRMFVSKPELTAVCSVGCCYHLLTEEFDPAADGCLLGACGFPLSRYLQRQSWFCGRNARMSACLALERVAVGQGIQMESLFFRAVLHVILSERYGGYKSERRVGNVYSKSTSFVDYVRRALQRLELDDEKLSDSDIQAFHDTYAARKDEMHAFNMLKVILAPCIEGLILLDRLCYLKEQEDVSFSGLVQLFDPVLSPRCFAVVGLKGQTRPRTS
ncbi:methyltransferase-like protein 25 [Cololabis saira]|uniref:methyltransferase-like protein 25 n=1 Tax=Cololabis saira TaxID=129043 RepID=UPI002AD55280|nr:methyltransferase-like protein 25 [Cololabis saira]